MGKQARGWLELIQYLPIFVSKKKPKQKKLTAMETAAFSGFPAVCCRWVSLQVGEQPGAPVNASQLCQHG